jgi:hypothetical protein
MAENIKHARAVAQRIATTLGALVIDPTQFDDVEGWEQPDYHTFWLDVIDTFARKVVFCDGWHFSTGCCIELDRAHSRGLSLCDEQLSPLTDDKAISLLESAIEQMRQAGFSTSAQERALQSLLEHPQPVPAN